MDGSQWRIIKSPDPSRAGNGLASVAAASSDDVWAVGVMQSVETTHRIFGAYTQPRDPVVIRTEGLILHWDGRSWQVVAFPRLGQYQILSAITAYSSQDVWAAGLFVTESNQGQIWHGLLEHWDGSSWHSTEDLHMQIVNTIATSASGGLWSVGLTTPPRNVNVSEQTIVEACA